MAVELEQYQLNLIKKSAERNGYRNVEIEAEPGSAKGDNYLGFIYAVRVKDADSDRVLHLILKSAPSDDNVRATVAIKIFFEREAFMYRKVLPELYKLQDDKGVVDKFQGSARCFGATLVDTEESILMENLKKIGYRMWERKKPMDDSHVSLVFAEYAKFHASSIALKHLEREKFDELGRNLHSVFDSEGERAKGTTKAIIESSFRSILEVVGDDDRLRKPVEKFSENQEQFFADMYEEKYAFTHGDCWTNNILFKYEQDPESGEPSRVRFLDWQMSALGTPVTDLAYFFCVCAPRELLYDYRKYFDLYHRVLSKNLKEFGCEPDVAFGYDTLMAQWKKYAKFGIIVGIMMLKAILTDVDEVPELSNMKDGENLASLITFDEEKQKIYNKRVLDLMEFLVDHDLL